nr:MAG TPA: hypothetical protein [Caudoviricetes sp.]
MSNVISMRHKKARITLVFYRSHSVMSLFLLSVINSSSSFKSELEAWFLIKLRADERFDR